MIFMASGTILFIQTSGQHIKHKNYLVTLPKLSHNTQVENIHQPLSLFLLSVIEEVRILVFKFRAMT
jgi:hypothetical protein